MDMVGDTKFVVVIRYRGWSISLDRDRDEYSIMDLVRDAHAFLNKPPIEGRSQFVSLSSHPQNKPSLKWPVNNDNELMKMLDKWKRRKRIEFVIMERKSPTMIDKLLLQLDGSLGGMNVDGIDESPLHSTLSIVLNVPLSTEVSIPLNTPCSSLPTPSSHKADLTEAQIRPDGYWKDVMVNDEDGESDDEDDDEFEGKSSASEGLESTESDGSVINEDQIFESDSGDDDKWERVKRCPIKKNKKRDKDEGLKKRTRGRSTTIKCSHCKQFGHNKVGCTLAGKQPYQRKKQPPIGRPVGWPRKVQLKNPTQVAFTSIALCVSQQPRRSRRKLTCLTQDDCTSMNAPSPQLPRTSPRKVASTEPSKNNNQGNFESLSTPLSRIITATVKKPTTKKGPQNASSS
ncbi:hypothetical protein Cgig2_020464 [Carnegiea gigantea]|uniref:Uncharacterized protein n=1 Tax=Carnegiea gigantea TaxID=171969 RepID=A0A9Q1JKU7_9CARY|nr:hypothetical protein Cgig2_020464 [Carnegiea gigantea]